MSDTETKNDTNRDKQDKTTAKTPQKKSAYSRQQTKHRSLFSFILLLCILIAASGYGAWQFNRKIQAELDDRFETISSQVDQLQHAQRYQSDEQQTQLNQLDEKQQELQRSFGILLKSSRHLKNDWLLAEASYLVKLAGHRLVLQQDIDTAITALQAADDRLKDIADPGLLSARKELAESIQSLQAIEQPDIAGMALKISALMKQLPSLPRQTPDPSTMQQREQSSTHGAEISSWKALPGAIWKDLKSLVIIRDHARPVQPLIPPEQAYFLTQNLNLKLDQARLSLLKGDNTLYRDSLNNAREWVMDYFDTENAATQQFVHTLDELLQTNIQPAIPDISHLYKTLEDLRLPETRPETPPASDAVDPADSEKTPGSSPS